jgi:hypothetical protein
MSNEVTVRVLAKWGLYSGRGTIPKVLLIEAGIDDPPEDWEIKL